MSLRLIASMVGLIVGAAALVLQFSLTIPTRMGNGHDLADALVYYFTFYTILTNLMLVLIYMSDVSTARWLAWWRSPVTRGMMAGVMVLVCGFYHFLLAGLWAPEGWFKVADVTLHYVTPILYVLWWLVFQPKGTLGFKTIPLMLLPTAMWLVWAMARGAVVNEYPYPILEAHKLGYGAVAINCAVVLALLVLLLAAVAFIDRALGRRAVAKPGV